MKPFVFIALLASACWSSGANAYWQRSHWAACSEAQTEAERIRLNCYIFAPAYHWPVERYAVELPSRYQLLPRVRK